MHLEPELPAYELDFNLPYEISDDRAQCKLAMLCRSQTDWPETHLPHTLLAGISHLAVVLIWKVLESLWLLIY